MTTPLPGPFMLFDAQQQTIHWPIPTKIDLPMAVKIPPMQMFAEQQLAAYGKDEYERGLLDAMNATRAFGKTGEVIAVIIAALRTKPSLTCAKCGVDRMHEACKQPGPTCPLMGEAQ